MSTHISDAATKTAAASHAFLCVPCFASTGVSCLHAAVSVLVNLITWAIADRSVPMQKRSTAAPVCAAS